MLILCPSWADPSRLFLNVVLACSDAIIPFRFLAHCSALTLISECIRERRGRALYLRCISLTVRNPLASECARNYDSHLSSFVFCTVRRFTRISLLATIGETARDSLIYADIILRTNVASLALFSCVVGKRKLINSIRMEMENESFVYLLRIYYRQYHIWKNSLKQISHVHDKILKFCHCISNNFRMYRNKSIII